MASLFSEALDFALPKAGKDSDFKLKTEQRIIIEAVVDFFTPFSSVFRDLLIPLKLLTKISKSKKLFLPRIFVISGARRESVKQTFNLNEPIICSSRKPMRKTPVSGFPRALLSLSHARKR